MFCVDIFNITTDPYNLIVDYRIMENQSDVEMAKPIAESLIGLFLKRSWSFDKGFWNKNNKAMLEEHVEKVVMPKKGKCNKLEQAEEGHRSFKLLRIGQELNEIKRQSK